MKLHFVKRVRPMFLYFTTVFILAAPVSTISCKKAIQVSGNDEQNDQAQQKTDVAPSFTYQKIFTGGQDGYHSYRIPSIVRTNANTLIAICEGRTDSNRDYGNINIVCKRSTDNGVTWQALQTIAGPGNYTDGNPTAVVDKTNGKIWVFMMHNDSTHYSNPDGTYLAFQPGDRTVWACYSTNDGVSWSAPVNLTSSTQPAGTTQDYTGPGVGIQKAHGSNIGRLIIPTYGRNIYSDDNGATWHNTTYASGTSKSTEATIVEKLNGDLMRNDRGISTAPYERQVSVGFIGTGGFSTWTSDPHLPDPKCEGSIMRYNDPKPNRIMFLNSASATTRTTMKIRITYDEGLTWAIDRNITISAPAPAKFGGYSSMTKTADFMVGALIEFNEDGGDSSTSHRSIEFVKFNLPWILNGATEPAGY
jgi:sialidase-1